MRIIRIFTLIFAVLMLVQFTYAAFDFAYLDVTLLNQDPDPANQDDYVELRWKVQKLGNDKIDDLSFTLDVDYPFSFDASDKATKSIGDWDGYSETDEFFTLYYKLRVDEDALEGTYTVTLSANQGGVAYQDIGEYDVRVGDRKKPELVLGTIQTDPVKLVSDTDEAKIDIQIENIGDGNAENVKVELAMPKGFEPSYSYAERVNLGTVLADSSDTATFYLDIAEDIEGKAYHTNLTVEYKEADDDDNELKKIIIPFEIQVKEKPEFEVTKIVTTPEDISPGDEVTIKITVKNTGGKEGESVSLRVFKDSSQPFDFDEKSDYIGSLKPGEEGDAVVKLTVDQEATQKEYSFNLEIRSIYQDDVLVQEESMNLLVNHVEESKQGSSPLIGVVIIVLIVVAALAGFFIGKGKKAKS